MITNKAQIQLKELQKVSEHYDLLICSASFEERCLALASSLSPEAFDHALICRYRKPAELSEENYTKLVAVLGNKGKEVLIDKDTPLAIYDTLHDAIQNKKPRSILLDISTFTRETILIALILFRQEPFSDVKVTLGYVPADRYSDADKTGASEIWLSRGVNEIRTILGYSGSFSSLKKTMLIVLVGFEKERAHILINSFEADKLYLGHVPPTESYSEELSEINHANFERLACLSSGCSTFEFSCRNIQHTYDKLKELIEENKEQYNIIISPLNNKLSTLAVAAVAFEYPEVQVCYASTNQYNTEAYSSPANEAFFFDFC